MRDDVAAYLDGVAADRRPLFDRVHRLVLEVAPYVDVVLSYAMPTFVRGDRRLHVGVWKHGLSFYGWERAHADALVQRHPDWDSGRGTLKLPADQAAKVSDDELRAFLTAVLS